MKEYYEEQFIPETGRVERKKLWFVYEYTPEVRKELEDSAPLIRDAIAQFFAEESKMGHLPFEKKEVREVAGTIESEVDEELFGLRGPDSTLALAFVEAHYASLKRAEQTLENYFEHSGELTQDEISNAARDLDEARHDQERFMRLAETMYSVHPGLARLYTRKDLLDWIEWTKNNLKVEARKLKKSSEGGSNIELGEAENSIESFERFLRGRPIAADYDVLLKRITEVREDAAARFPDLLIKYAARDGDKEARKEIVDIEWLIFQYDQMRRMLEDEKRLKRGQGIKR